MDVNLSKNPANPSTPVVDVPATVTQVATPTPAPAAPASQLPATLPPVGLPATGQKFLLGDILPDFSDMAIPRINIVQNIGELSKSFQSGEILYGQQTVLFTPAIVDAKNNTIKQPASPPVVVTFLGFRPTRFVEKTSGGVRGLIVNTEAEVRAAGGTLDFQEWKLKEKDGMKRFEYLADTMVAIEKPDAIKDDDTVFVYEVNGKKYALALWAVRGTAYTNLCKKTLFPARRLQYLRQGGYPSWSFNLSSREESYPGGHAAWIPVALPRAKSTPEFMAFAADILTGGAAPAEQPAETAAS